MDKIDSCIACFFENYPHKNELQPHRIMQLLYLADWKSCIHRGRQITHATWYRGAYGANSKDIRQTLQQNYPLSNDNLYVELSKREKNILEWIIKITKDKYSYDFMYFVNSTFPIKKSNQLDEMNLQKLSKEYNENNF